MMRLADLNPMFSSTDRVLSELSFDCPIHGAPFRVSVWCAPKAVDRKAPTWVSNQEYPYPWDTLTLTPSIQNHHHGRKLACN